MTVAVKSTYMVVKLANHWNVSKNLSFAFLVLFSIFFLITTSFFYSIFIIYLFIYLFIWVEDMLFGLVFLFLSISYHIFSEYFSNVPHLLNV